MQKIYIQNENDNERKCLHLDFLKDIIDEMLPVILFHLLYVPYIIEVMKDKGEL